MRFFFLFVCFLKCHRFMCSQRKTRYKDSHIKIETKRKNSTELVLSVFFKVSNLFSIH